MKIAIIEDSIEDQTILISYLKTYMESSSLVFSIDTFSSGEEFMKTFTAGKYALIFLDIFMNSQMNGMDVAKNIRIADTVALIVFTTSSPDFAIQGYSVAASDYLLKPFNYEYFYKAFHRITDLLNPDAGYIEIKSGRFMTKILLSDIIYCDYHNHYIQVHTNQSTIRSYMKFADLMHMLNSHTRFLNCYRNIVINMDFVEKMENGFFIMKDNSTIPMKRENRTECKNIYSNYVFQKVQKKLNAAPAQKSKE